MVSWIVHGLYMVSAPPPITMGGGLKTNEGVISIPILLHFHDFISLETANTQKSELFLLIFF